MRRRGALPKSLGALVARTALFLLSVQTDSFAVAAYGERGNATSLFELPYWSGSGSNDESDLLRLEEPFADSGGNDANPLDGGFYFLDGMLRWAIGHSDPDKLNETARDLQRPSSRGLKQRQTEITGDIIPAWLFPHLNKLSGANLAITKKHDDPNNSLYLLHELLNEWKTPTDVQLMQRAIRDLENTSLSRDENLSAMQEILLLVEPVDNANDFSRIGGLRSMVRFLNHDDPEMRRYSAWVIGKCSQNNPVVQNQVLDLGGLAGLMVMVKSTFVEEAVKALYAISSVVRNNFAGQELFFSAAGHMMILDILGSSSKDTRLHKKAVTLVSDIAESLSETGSEDVLPPLFRGCSFLKYFVNLLDANDYDLREKALGAIMNLLLLGSIEAVSPRELCGLDVALVRLRQQLHSSTADELHRDFAADMYLLLGQAELFLRDLEIGNFTA